MPKIRPEGPRPYVEAFPSLDALAVERMAKAGRRLCEWVDEKGRVVGHIRIREFSETRLVFDQLFAGSEMLVPEAGQRTIEILRSHRVQEHSRPSFLCQGCGNHVGRVNLVLGAWRCCGCHKPGYYSQRASKVSQQILRLDYLRRRLARGRDSFESKRDYRHLTKEFGTLIEALINYGGYKVPAPVRHILFAEWISEVRGPVILWKEKAVPPVVPSVELPSPKAKPRAIFAAPWFGVEEDSAIGGFSQASGLG